MRSPWRAQVAREWARARLGARRALGCTLLASAWIGTWLLGVWLYGALVVYDDVHASAAPAPSVAVLPSTPLASRPSQRYAFDALPREVRGALACPEVELVEHAGSGVAFLPAARVAAPFRERLAELERVVREVSAEVYGRSPSALLVAASHDCRPVTGNRARLSEHALGNAIDITGFRFAAAGQRPAFEVRVDEHWQHAGEDPRHARFLDALTRALIARDVFRTLLGPAHPEHDDHFHFDMAPHRYVHL